ncbi:MAG: methyltransferase [Candidatus Lokiarchaeota archaeon]|nr:methyltransferase [Candidatus Lokiarchaeota archaeon]
MRGSFKKNLIDFLGNKIDEKEKKYLPSGYQQLGHVIILNLNDQIMEKKELIGNATLQIVKNCKTVCIKTGKIQGQFREPQLEKIAGNGTETTVIEYGIKYHFDAMEIMFAKGNINERRRYIDLIEKDEIIFDFFAGIGYFTLSIAKDSAAKRIYAFEINPTAFKYLKKNLELNSIPSDKVQPIKGDCTVEALKIEDKADRILMGILPSPKSSLETAFKVLNTSAGIIHYEGLLKNDSKADLLFNDVKKVAKLFNRNIELKHLENIKSYAPYVQHVCLDIEVR